LLLRGYSAAVAESVVNQLRSQSFLDDATFAQNWASVRSARGYGPQRIERELEVKGIPRPAIREAVGKLFNQADEEQKAKSLLEKKFKVHRLGDPKVLRRAAAFLQRRGFTAQVVHRLLQNAVQED
jgi:regulatory protein